MNKNVKSVVSGIVAGLKAEGTPSKPRAKAQKPKKQKGNGNVGRSVGGKRQAHPLFGSPNFISNSQTVPAAFCEIQGSATYLQNAGPCKHAKEGLNGVALVGCQPFTDVITTGANSNLFTTGTLATTSANAANLDPDSLNGPLAAQANLHKKYVFTDIMFEFCTNVATTQAGSMALAVQEDGASTGGATDFATTRSCAPSVTFPFRSDKVYLHYHYNGDNLWYTEADTATTGGQRLTVQAQLFGWPSASSIGAVTQGFMNVYYRIELYQSVNSQGFTVVVHDKEERELLKQFLIRLRTQCLPSPLKTTDGGEADFELISKAVSKRFPGKA